MPLFRKKPVVIEAWPARELLSLAAHNWSALPRTIVEAYNKGDLVFASDAVLVKTLAGTMTAHHDDMVIRGVKGELYPCEFEIFQKTYDAVL